MKRSWVTVVAAIVCTLAFFACRTAGPQPEPHAGAAVPPPGLPALTSTTPPKDLGMVERYGWQTVEQMREAYVAADAAAFLTKVSRGFYRGYGNLESSLQHLFAVAARIDLAIAIQEVATEEDKVSVRVKWNRSWAMKDGSVAPLAGESVLIFLRTDGTLRLIDYRKDPLFGLEGI